jgi:hypothetical protein
MYTYAAKVWDSLVVQGPFSVAPCQTYAIRFATCASLQVLLECILSLSMDDWPTVSVPACAHLRTMRVVVAGGRGDTLHSTSPGRGACNDMCRSDMAVV